MRHDARRRIFWTVWTSGGALVLTVLIWLVTDSSGWALLVLLAAGPALSTIAQMVVRPARAGRRATRSEQREAGAPRSGTTTPLGSS